jgi:hypothetical protein
MGILLHTWRQLRSVWALELRHCLAQSFMEQPWQEAVQMFLSFLVNVPHRFSHESFVVTEHWALHRVVGTLSQFSRH